VRGLNQVAFQWSAPRGGAADPSSHEPGAIGLLESPVRDGGPGGARRQPPEGEPPLGRPLLRWVLWVALFVAALGAMLAEGTILTAMCVVALVGLAALQGWRLGEDRREALEQEIDNRSSELRRALTELEIAQAETVRRLSMAVEFRDEDTGAHIERIGRFSTLLAEQVGLEVEYCERISHAAPLHDVGKVAIPDAILLKPGALTHEERAIVETHAEEGHRLLRGSSSSILDLAATIALSHHEKWDGTGYPRGLAGEDIPIEGRIVAIADVFDALTSDRVYRKAFSVEEAIEMMREQRGRHFDPVLLDAFLDVLGSTGPDARAHHKADPQALVARVLDVYTQAIARGDAEMAEATIAQAIEDGIAPATLHGEVIAPAMERIGELWECGEIDVDTEGLATVITRRILATMYRYMLGAAEPSRERVLLAGVKGDEHTLGLQMVHDQLAAAGFQTALDTDLSAERLSAVIDSQAPDLIVLGATMSTAAHTLERLVGDLRVYRPDIPILLGGAAAGRLPRSHPGVRVLERIDQSVPAVEELLAAREHTPRDHALG
jgi:HD-GYP domain-containing protein (c-di-GMP phosphodiesterase class II)/methylmalonyl-CoA mutase cobalamin-binding subunit